MESRIRTFFKTVSWRFFATLITSLVVWAVTGKVELGLSVATLDCLIKLVAYYFHERAWNSISYGYSTPRRLAEPLEGDWQSAAHLCASRRHLNKTRAQSHSSAAGLTHSESERQDVIPQAEPA